VERDPRDPRRFEPVRIAERGANHRAAQKEVRLTIALPTCVCRQTFGQDGSDAESEDFDFDCAPVGPRAPSPRAEVAVPAPVEEAATLEPAVLLTNEPSPHADTGAAAAPAAAAESETPAAAGTPGTSGAADDGLPRIKALAMGALPQSKAQRKAWPPVAAGEKFVLVIDDLNIEEYSDTKCEITLEAATDERGRKIVKCTTVPCKNPNSGT
jgi:hypothetical protein